MNQPIKYNVISSTERVNTLGIVYSHPEISVHSIRQYIYSGLAVLTTYEQLCDIRSI